MTRNKMTGASLVAMVAGKVKRTQQLHVFSRGSAESVVQCLQGQRGQPHRSRVGPLDIVKSFILDELLIGVSCEVIVHKANKRLHVTLRFLLRPVPTHK